MLETHQMPATVRGRHVKPLIADQDLMAVVNVRGNARDPAFAKAVLQALGQPLPMLPCSTLAAVGLRLVWVGPDDWFVIGTAGQEQGITQRMRAALVGQHCAVTDVSSGYLKVTLAGAQARDVLAQGCPLDLHPRVFRPGQSAGTHFFKVGITLWQRDEVPTFEMLVRRSFIDHFWQLIDYCVLDYGREARQAA